MLAVFPMNSASWLVRGCQWCFKIYDLRVTRYRCSRKNPWQAGKSGGLKGADDTRGDLNPIFWFTIWGCRINPG